MNKIFAVILMVVMFVSAAHAGRVFPQIAQRGTLYTSESPYVFINKDRYRLAPGVKIYDQNNRSLLTANLPSSANILYIADKNGDLLKIWLLTPEEQIKLNQLSSQ